VDPNTQISPGRSCLLFSAYYHLIPSPGLTQKKPPKKFCSWFKFHKWLHFSFCPQINKKYVDLYTWVSPGRSYSSFSTDYLLPLGQKNAAGKSINTGPRPCPSRYNILRAPKFNYPCSGLLSSPILYGTNNIHLREGSPSAHPSLMKNYILMSSSMSYETLRGPELSPLAPYYMGHCHPPFFHVIWYQVAIVCVCGVYAYSTWNPCGMHLIFQLIFKSDSKN